MQFSEIKNFHTFFRILQYFIHIIHNHLHGDGVFASTTWILHKQRKLGGKQLLSSNSVSMQALLWSFLCHLVMIQLSDIRCELNTHFFKHAN